MDEAFSRCEVVVERSFKLPRIEHAFLEPESGIGISDPDGGVTIKIGTQCAHDDQEILERILNLPKEKVRVIQMLTGGAFRGQARPSHPPIPGPGNLEIRSASENHANKRRIVADTREEASGRYGFQAWRG